MPYSRRRRLRSTSRYSRYSRRYRRYRRYARLGRYVKYSNGRESSSVNLKVVTNGYFNGPMSAGANDSGVFCLPSLSYTGALGANYVGPVSALNSNLFRAYCSLYGELKLRGVLYEISVVNPIGTAASQVPSFMIFASVDRRYSTSNTTPTSAQLSNYASITPSTYVANNRTKFKKYIGARDLIERTQYIDSQLRHQAANGWSLIAAAPQTNPNFFIPAMYFFIRFPFTLATAFNVQLSVRATYYVTFRNPIPFDTVPAAAGAAAAASTTDVPLPTEDSEFMDLDPHPLSGSTEPTLTET